eukprot:scaffold237_cov421-Prasinococcus_capsulatus_cf.AAC.16
MNTQSIRGASWRRTRAATTPRWQTVEKAHESMLQACSRRVPSGCPCLWCNSSVSQHLYGLTAKGPSLVLKSPPQGAPHHHHHDAGGDDTCVQAPPPWIRPPPMLAAVHGGPGPSESYTVLHVSPALAAARLHGGLHRLVPLPWYAAACAPPERRVLRNEWRSARGRAHAGGVPGADAEDRLPSSTRRRG